MQTKKLRQRSTTNCLFASAKSLTRINQNSKSQITNTKQITMTEIQNPKREYDLEERTFQFAKAVRLFVKTLPKTIANIEVCFGH